MLAQQNKYSELILMSEIPFEPSELVILAAYNLREASYVVNNFIFTMTYLNDNENHYHFGFNCLEFDKEVVVMVDDPNFIIAALKLYLKSWEILFEFTKPSLTQFINVLDVNYKHIKEPTIDLISYDFLYKGNIFRRRIKYDICTGCEYDYLGKISLIEGDFHLIRSSGFGDRK
jgi:hypothetical protein